MNSPRLRIALLALLGFVLARPAPAQVAGVAVNEGGVAKGQVMGGIARLDFSGCTVVKSANTFTITCTGVAGNPAGSAGQLQFNSAGTAFGGVTKWTSNGTTTLTGLATGILDLGALTLANVKFPTAATTGFLRVTTTTGALTSGEFTGDVSNTALATTVIATHLSSPLPKAQGGAGADMTNVTFPGTGTLATTAAVPAAGSCTNKAVTALTNGSAPTCTTLTSAYVDNSIALTGTDINTSNQVTATHLAAALPLLQGGTGQTTKAAAYDALNPNTTRGDLTYRGASNNVRLAVGTNGQCLVSNGTDPSWGSCATGSVGGTGTTGTFTQWTAANTIGDTSLSQSGTQLIFSGVTGLALTGSGTFLKALEGAAPTGSAGSDWLYGDSTAHRWKVKNNNNTADTLALFSDNLSVFAATTSAQLAGVVSDEQGSGALVFATSPTLTTPVLGVATATSVNGLSFTGNATGFSVAGGTTSKTLTMANTLTFSGTDASSVAFGAGGTVAYTGGNLSQFAATTSAQLRGVLSDETGSGAGVFADTPTLITPVLGVATATSINKVAITAPATSATLTIANGKTLTVSNTMTLAGGDSSVITFPNATATALTTNAAVTIAQGGTGAATQAAAFDALGPTTTRGDMIYRGASNNVRLAVGTNNQCLTSNGTDPVWGSCSTGSITGSGLASSQVAFASSTSAITSSSGFTSDASGNVSVNSLTITGTSGGNLIGIPATTTAPTLVSSAFNWVAPNAASITAYAWQPPTGENGTAGILHVGAASSHISALTIGLVNLAAGGDVTGVTPVANGGTGQSSLTAFNVPIGNGTSSVSLQAPIAGGLFTSSSASANPTFTATPTIGNLTATQGTLTLAAGASGGSVKLSPGATGTSWTFVLPTTHGTNGQCLITAGSDTTATSWGACGTGGSSTLDTIGGAAAPAVWTNGDNTISSQSQLSTASASAWTFTESAASTSTGTPFLVNINTLATSTLNPLQVTALGTSNGIRVDTTGLLSAIGTGGINATQLSGKTINGAGAGIVTGPTSSTSGRVANFTGTSGALAVSSVVAADIVTAASAAGAANQVIISGGADKSATYVTADTTTTHALFATAGAPAFRALAAGDLPSTLTSGTAITNASLTTPSLGVATATSINKVAFTAPTTAGTIAFAADNSTATLPNGNVSLTVASGTSALGTSSIASGACASVVTTTATGTATTDTIIYTPNADPTGVTGYAVSATGSLYIWGYPTTNNVNWKVCNNTAGALTPGALTLNWRVVR